MGLISHHHILRSEVLYLSLKQYFPLIFLEIYIYSFTCMNRHVDNDNINNNNPRFILGYTISTASLHHGLVHQKDYTCNALI